MSSLVGILIAHWLPMTQQDILQVNCFTIQLTYFLLYFGHPSKKIYFSYVAHKAVHAFMQIFSRWRRRLSGVYGV